jgi:hypothetical protein
VCAGRLCPHHVPHHSSCTACYRQATPFQRQGWTSLNAFIGLLGYYAAAASVDKSWYGRVRMQAVGFAALFVVNAIIFGQVCATDAELDLRAGLLSCAYTTSKAWTLGFSSTPQFIPQAIC